MTITRSAVAVSALLAAYMLSVAAPRVAVSMNESDALDEATLTDHLLIAKKNGWTLDEAIAHEHSADELIEVNRQLVEQWPEVFVGSAVGTSPYDPPTIFIKGHIGDGVRSVIESAKVAITIKDGQPFSFEELRERRSAIHGELLRAGYSEVMTRTDIMNRGSVTITIGRERGGLPTPSEVLGNLPAHVRSDISVRFIDAPIHTPENRAFGGMWHTIAGGDFCTIGWSVQNLSSGVTGVTTAGHCLGHGSDGVRHSGYGVHPATLKARVTNSRGDIGWLTTAEPNPAKYYAALNDVRPVEKRASFPADYPLFHEICVFGRASAAAGQGDHGRECATLIDPEANCGPLFLVMMYPDVTQAGDSGAPWSRFKKAFGSHVGSCVDGQDSVFMRVDLFPATLNVQVRTQ